MTPARYNPTPVKIEQKWFSNWDRQSQTDFDDYFYIITYADGSTEERWTIPNEWLAIERGSREARAA
jgi:sarcosine oxidase delta subunit